MKKNITLFALLFLVNIHFYGQRDEKSREKIMSAKISFISDELSLSTTQAEKFWPIYKSFKKESYSLHKEKRNLECRTDFSNISENDALDIINQIIKKEKGINHQKELFYEEITKVISYKQFLILIRTEHDFKKNLLERIKHKN